MQTILITARIHPGESNSSFIISGLINHLLSPSGLALLSLAIFKIIPMLNPDGVITGNYRTGLAGFDLNRQFNEAADFVPTVKGLMKLAGSIYAE